MSTNDVRPLRQTEVTMISDPFVLERVIREHNAHAALQGERIREKIKSRRTTVDANAKRDRINSHLASEYLANVKSKLKKIRGPSSPSYSSSHKGSSTRSSPQSTSRGEFGWHAMSAMAADSVDIDNRRRFYRSTPKCEVIDVDSWSKQRAMSARMYTSANTNQRQKAARKGSGDDDACGGLPFSPVDEDGSRGNRSYPRPPPGSAPAHRGLGTTLKFSSISLDMRSVDDAMKKNMFLSSPRRTAVPFIKSSSSSSLVVSRGQQQQKQAETEARRDLHRIEKDSDTRHSYLTTSPKKSAARSTGKHLTKNETAEGTAIKSNLDMHLSGCDKKKKGTRQQYHENINNGNTRGSYDDGYANEHQKGDNKETTDRENSIASSSTATLFLSRSSNAVGLDSISTRRQVRGGSVSINGSNSSRNPSLLFMRAREDLPAVGSGSSGAAVSVGEGTPLYPPRRASLWTPRRVGNEANPHLHHHPSPTLSSSASPPPPRPRISSMYGPSTPYEQLEGTSQQHLGDRDLRGRGEGVEGGGEKELHLTTSPTMTMALKRRVSILLPNTTTPSFAGESSPHQGRRQQYEKIVRVTTTAAAPSPLESIAITHKNEPPPPFNSGRGVSIQSKAFTHSVQMKIPIPPSSGMKMTMTTGMSKKKTSLSSSSPKKGVTGGNLEQQDQVEPTPQPSSAPPPPPRALSAFKSLLLPPTHYSKGDVYGTHYSSSAFGEEDNDGEKKTTEDQTSVLPSSCVLSKDRSDKKTTLLHVQLNNNNNNNNNKLSSIAKSVGLADPSANKTGGGGVVIETDPAYSLPPRRGHNPESSSLKSSVAKQRPPPIPPSQPKSMPSALNFTNTNRAPVTIDAKEAHQLVADFMFLSYGKSHVLLDDLDEQGPECKLNAGSRELVFFELTSYASAKNIQEISFADFCFAAYGISKKQVREMVRWFKLSRVSWCLGLSWKVAESVHDAFNAVTFGEGGGEESSGEENEKDGMESKGVDGSIRRQGGGGQGKLDEPAADERSRQKPVTFARFRRYVKNAIDGKTMKEDDLMRLFLQIDTDGDGVLSKEEFAKLFMLSK